MQTNNGFHSNMGYCKKYADIFTRVEIKSVPCTDNAQVKYDHFIVS